MLEQISGSAELIDQVHTTIVVVVVVVVCCSLLIVSRFSHIQYNKCLAAKQEAEDNTIFAFQKKKVFTSLLIYFYVWKVRLKLFVEKKITTTGHQRREEAL
jgi:hypothetical protein